MLYLQKPVFGTKVFTNKKLRIKINVKTMQKRI